MEIHRIKIENFKGLKSFEHNFDGQDMVISGTNGAGKTTIMDAVSWILTDKDSTGASTSSFSIKPLTPDGEHIHRIETVVTIELNDASWDESVELQKVFKEKWTKKNSSEHDEITGHTTKYLINGFAKKESEYKEFVSENIISEDMLWLLSDPMAFNSLHWKKAREILNEMAEPKSDYKIIQDEGFDSLAEIMSKDATIDDLRNKINSQKSKMEEEKIAIPHRIDELYNAIKGIEQVEQKDIDTLHEKIESLDREITRLKTNSGGDVGQRTYEIDEEIDRLQKKIQRKREEEKEDLSAAIGRTKDDIGDQQEKAEESSEKIDEQEKRFADLTERIEQKKKEYYEEQGKLYTEESLLYCPECGQYMPEEMRAYKMLTLNEKKAEKIDRIVQEGKRLKKEREAAREKISALSAAGEDALKRKTELKAKLQQQREQYEKIEEKSFSEIEDKIESLEEEKNNMKKDGALEQEINGLEDKKMTLKAQMSQLERAKAEYEAGQKSRQRIGELEKEEKALAKKIEMLERQLYEVGIAETRKAENIQENINSKFNLARFNLFKVQVNGGIRPICETTYNGVPFNRGLNNGSKINVGLDIISTLSSHYGVKCPIFIDNAESVLDIIDTESQQIYLFVAKNKKLKVGKANE